MPTSPHCPVLTECGGCPLMPHSADEQAAIKLEGLKAALASYGVELPPPTGRALNGVEWVEAGERVGYRNRLRLKVETDRSVRFFNAHKLPSCVVLDPRLAAAVRELCERASQSVAAGQCMPELQFASHLELRVSDTGEIGLCIYSEQREAAAPHPAAPQLAAPQLAAPQLAAPQLAAPQLAARERHLPAQWRVAWVKARPAPRATAATHTAAGEPCDTGSGLTYYLEDMNSGGGANGRAAYQVPLSAFVQVNSAVNRALIRRLRALVQAAGFTRFIDLYAGAGNFSLPLLRAGLSGLSVEQSASAAAALRHGAARITQDHRTLTGDAHQLLSALEPCELVIANPPRGGLKHSAPRVAELASAALALCSCNPQSLARDLSQLLPCGFKLSALVAFDMFPHTHHLETLAWLTRQAPTPTSLR